MALVTVVSIRPAHADPADIFPLGAPTIGADQPKASALMDGDASVATQTGALQYSYPIQVPPGRNGVQPHLALTYSSQGPIYGGIAAGWSLSIPMITEDTVQGQLANEVLGVPTVTKRYSSSMAGGRPLITVTEPSGDDVIASYRAQNDTSFVRYQRVAGAFSWRAFSPDGTVYYFGDTDHAACAVLSDGYAPLTRTVDPFQETRSITPTAKRTANAASTRSVGARTPGRISALFAAVTFQYGQPPVVRRNSGRLSEQLSNRNEEIVTGCVTNSTRS